MFVNIMRCVNLNTGVKTVTIGDINKKAESILIRKYTSLKTWTCKAAFGEKCIFYETNPSSSLQMKFSQ